MKRINQLIISTATCLLFIVTGYANSETEPSELTKLREEYRKKAQSEMAPLNARYLVLLERMEKSFSRSGDKENALAVRQEIKQFEANPARLLTYEAHTKMAFAGKYEHQSANNDYHYVVITKEAHGLLKWTNRNGNEWILTPTDDPLIFNIGKDCPYYNRGENTVIFKEEDGVTIGVRFLDGRDYYDKKER